jgi:hypothetical protein
MYKYKITEPHEIQNAMGILVVCYYKQMVLTCQKFNSDVASLRKWPWPCYIPLQKREMVQSQLLPGGT